MVVFSYLCSLLLLIVVVVGFSDIVSCSSGWPQNHYVPHIDLELLISLSDDIIGMCHHAQIFSVFLS